MPAQSFVRLEWRGSRWPYRVTKASPAPLYHMWITHDRPALNLGKSF
jgi:hypothetical protein